MPHFVSLDGIHGSSTSPGHEDWIDVLSFDWGVDREETRTGGGGGAGKVSVQDLSFVKRIDQATPLLHQSILSGHHHSTATLHCTRVNSIGLQETYYVLEMTNVLVTSFADNGDSGSVPTEMVSLNYEKIKVTYTKRT